MLNRATLWLPARMVYRICPSEVSARLVGWLPIGTAVPTEPVCGVIATIELPVTVLEPEPTLAMMLRENGSYRRWFTPSVSTLKIVSGTGFETPQPGAGFDTVTGAHP